MVEAYPTKKETAQVITKKLLEEILPRFRVPAQVGYDNGPTFVYKVSQGLAAVLGTNWKLHCAYRSQSSGQVERMNRTLKETLTKLTLETGGDWVALLPFALFRVRNSPYMLGLTPFEIMFGRPPPIVPSLKTDLIADLPVDALFSSLQLLQWVHKDIWKRLEALYLTPSYCLNCIVFGQEIGSMCGDTTQAPLNHAGKDPTLSSWSH